MQESEVCSMDIKQCYESFGGDYEDAYMRLLTDERIEKFLKKFVEIDDVGKLEAALSEKDYGEAFMRAHDLKGTSSNLGFTELYKSSSVLCEELRGGEPKCDVTAMFEKVRADCDSIYTAVGQLG